MKKLFAVITLLASIQTTLLAQVITGVVKDAKTNEKLPFVNVGIVGKSVGTVTNDDGVFKLLLNNQTSDTLRFSMIGYKSQSFLVGELTKSSNNISVNLIPDVQNLKEVKVSNRKWKTAVLGNTSKSQSTTFNFGDNRLGHEVGAVVKIKRSPTWLKQFNASLVDNYLTDSVKLRLNIYTVKDGLPDKNIAPQNIYVTVHKGDKAININLEPYNILVDDKFFVSLEWIQTARGRGLMFSASLFSSAIIARETSQANWEKVGIAGVGFNVLAEY